MQSGKSERGSMSRSTSNRLRIQELACLFHIESAAGHRPALRHRALRLSESICG